MVQPEYKTKHGAIQGTIWKNEREGKEGKPFTSYSNQIEKSYTKDDGQTWEKTTSFFAQDIDNVEKVVADFKEYYKKNSIETARKEKE